MPRPSTRTNSCCRCLPACLPAHYHPAILPPHDDDSVSPKKFPETAHFQRGDGSGWVVLVRLLLLLLQTSIHGPARMTTDRTIYRGGYRTYCVGGGRVSRILTTVYWVIIVAEEYYWLIVQANLSWSDDWEEILLSGLTILLLLKF